MYTRICLPLLLAVGCGSSTPSDVAKVERRSGPPRGSPAAGGLLHGGGAPKPVTPEGPAPEARARPGDPLPADLGTRAAGSDWAGFLGPTRDSVSAEKGIIAPW